MNLAKLFKLPKKLGDSMLISLINNMVDYLRNYDSAIKVDDNGYIHLAADDLYLEGNDSDIDIHGDGAIFLYSEYNIVLRSNNESDITLTSDANIDLNASDSINIHADNSMTFSCSGGEIYIEANDSDGDITLNADSDIELTASDSINIHADNSMTFSTSGGEIYIEANDSDVALSAYGNNKSKTLYIWPDDDGLEYRQDNNTYFKIDYDGLIYIKSYNTNYADKILQDCIIPDESIDVHILFDKDDIDSASSIEYFGINKTSFNKNIIQSYNIINVNDTNYYETILSYRPYEMVLFDGKLFPAGQLYYINFGYISENNFTHITNLYGVSVNDKSNVILPNLQKNIKYAMILNNTAFCYTADTLITLADGSTKQVKDITYDDELKVWNFDEGKDDIAKPLWIKRTEYAKSYQLVTLSDGNIIKLCGNDGKYHCMFDVTEQKFNHAVDCIGHEVYTENGIATVVSIEEVKEKVDHYNIVTNYHMNLYANHILTSTEKNNIYPIVDMKFVKDDRKIVPYEEFEKAHISREYYDGWRAGEWNEPLKDVITHLRRRKMYAKPQKRVKDGLRTDYFG